MADILTVDKFSQFIGDQSRVSKDVEDIYLNSLKIFIILPII